MRSPVTEDQIRAALRDVAIREEGRELEGNPEAARTPEERCMQLEEENRRLKLLVADLVLRNEALKLVVAKKW